MSEQEHLLEPTAADGAVAVREWSKQHGKSTEQVRHLTNAEAAECYRLAQSYVQARVLRNGAKAEGDQA